MVGRGDWALEFHVDERGRSPVEEFLDSLDEKTRARFRWSAEQLRVRNVRAREPLVRHLEGDLWELREESATKIYRVIYIFFTGRRIVLLHGFQKRASGRRPASWRPPEGAEMRSWREKPGGVDDERES